MEESDYYGTGPQYAFEDKDGRKLELYTASRVVWYAEGDPEEGSESPSGAKVVKKDPAAPPVKRKRGAY